jgi:Fe-S cluster assembly scaffold protein SufB
MPIQKALKLYDWIGDYYWKLVAVDADKYTASAELTLHDGYFIRALPGSKSIYPIQACLYLDKPGIQQNVHNIIIAEEGSELHIITGCTTAAHLRRGLHVGISEFFIKKNAKLSFTMIHNWAEDMHVRPRSACLIDKDGVFISNYIILRPVKTLQMHVLTFEDTPRMSPYLLYIGVGVFDERRARYGDQEVILLAPKGRLTASEFPLEIAKKSLRLSPIPITPGTLGRLGHAYRQLGQYEEANRYLEESLKISKSLNHPSYIGASLYWIGDNLLRMNKPDEAVKYLKDAVEIPNCTVKTRGNTIHVQPKKVEAWEAVRRWLEHGRKKPMRDSNVLQKRKSDN